LSSPSQHTGADARDGESPPVWRIVLLVAVLAACVLAYFSVTGGLQDSERTGEACFQALFSRRTSRALETFREYRERNAEDIPAGVNNEFSRLRSIEQYPIRISRADAYFLERTVFLCLASDRAVQAARGVREGALHALRYVCRHVQSGVPEDVSGLYVMPFHVLSRGFGSAGQSAWIMATLLRFRGAHAAVVILPGRAGDERGYALCAVLIDRRLYLFDPYRAVPVCRAGDGRIADLAGLLSGRIKLGPGFGKGTPVTVDALRTAVYTVPADPWCIMPDAWLLDRLVREHGRRRYVIYRSFRGDLRNLGAAVFGENAAVSDRFAMLSRDGRDELVALWDHPFRAAATMAATGYADKLARAHKGAATACTAARHAQLHGVYDVAARRYQKALKVHAGDRAVIDDVTFFKASLPMSRPEAAAELGEASGKKRQERLARLVWERQAEELAAYLRDFPDGRWRPLATMRLAELEAARGNGDEAMKWIRQVRPPYALRAEFLRKTIEAGRRRLVWTFPEQPRPHKRPTTSPAETP
jgi:hypothetical protein